MSMFNLFRRQGSAPVARDRLQILLAHERAAHGQCDLLGIMREEILAVVAKHVTVERDNVAVRFARGSAFAAASPYPPPPVRPARLFGRQSELAGTGFIHPVVSVAGDGSRQGGRHRDGIAGADSTAPAVPSGSKRPETSAFSGPAVRALVSGTDPYPDRAVAHEERIRPTLHVGPVNPTLSVKLSSHRSARPRRESPATAGLSNSRYTQGRTAIVSPRSAQAVTSNGNRKASLNVLFPATPLPGTTRQHEKRTGESRRRLAPRPADRAAG